MSKYISEKTLRTIQIRNAKSRSQIMRTYWIELVCRIAITYQHYFDMRKTGEVSTINATVQEIEKEIDFANSVFDIDITLSDIYDFQRRSVDSSIQQYEQYKKILEFQANDFFKPKLVDMLCKELFEEDGENPINTFIFGYYSEVAILILDYMCEGLDYDTFMKNLLAIKLVPHQKPIDGTILRRMIRTGDKWEKRYAKLFKEERAKGNI